MSLLYNYIASASDDPAMCRRLLGRPSWNATHSAPSSRIASDAAQYSASTSSQSMQHNESIWRFIAILQADQLQPQQA